ncbi:hypothetical protein F4680DRAFT_438600 [Xylaria scruposa]|nr:hypothetical protein F4680DRAFT_438600 [Xylaria scruposa]
MQLLLPYLVSMYGWTTRGFHLQLFAASYFEDAWQASGYFVRIQPKEVSSHCALSPICINSQQQLTVSVFCF